MRKQRVAVPFVRKCSNLCFDCKLQQTHLTELGQRPITESWRRYFYAAWRMGARTNANAAVWKAHN